MSAPWSFRVCNRADHGGNIYAVLRAGNRPLERLSDFSASINPLGLSASARRAIEQALSLTGHYPDPEQYELRCVLGIHHDIDPSCIVLGNGSTELIYALPRALCIRHALILGPTFTEYERAIRIAGGCCTYVHATSAREYAPPLNRARQILRRDSGEGNARSRSDGGRPTTPIDAVFLCNPNSPTGRAVSKEDVVRLSRSVMEAGAWLIVDEVFVDFCPQHSVLRELSRYPRLVLLRSLTKFYAMPGLRIGYLLAHEEVIRRVLTVLPPWSVNVLAQHAALAALQDELYRRRSLAFMNRERKRLFARLRSLPSLRPIPSSANFLFVELLQGSVASLVLSLERRGLLIRDCTNFPGIRTQAFRIAIRTPGENNRLIRALQTALQEKG